MYNRCSLPPLVQSACYARAKPFSQIIAKREGRKNGSPTLRRVHIHKDCSNVGTCGLKQPVMLCDDFAKCHTESHILSQLNLPYHKQHSQL